MNWAMKHENNGDISQQPKMKHKGKHDKPKPWDDDSNIYHWKIDKFNLSWNETGMLEVSSFSICGSIGEVIEVRIMKGKDSGENKGFAFVTFRSAELASKAIDELNNTEFKKLGQARSKEGCPRGWAWSYTAVELVKDAKNPSINRGFAFVDYHNHACAKYSRQKVMNPKLKPGEGSVCEEFTEECYPGPAKEAI